MAKARPIFMDSCSHYYADDAPAFVNLGKWTGHSGTQCNGFTGGDVAYGRILGQGGIGTASSGGANRGFYKSLATTPVTVVFGCWYMSTTSSWVASNDFIGIGEGSNNNIHCGLRTDVNGKIGVYRAGTLIGSLSAAPVFTPGVWAWVEAKIKVHDTTGTIEVRVNGSTVVGPTTGLDTRAAGSGVVSSLIVNFHNGGANYMTSIFIADADDATDNDFLGPQICSPRLPVEAGNYAQWTPNFGPNFANVNEPVPDEDTTFNQSSTANQKDTFLGRDLPSTGAVSGIQHVIRARTDGGAHTMRPKQRISGTDYDGTTVSVPASYGYLLEPVYLSPATSSRFTAAELNGSENGYELIT